MRQVPHYLIIGNGRVARHFQHYFSLLSLSYDTWQRSQSIAELHLRVQNATHILLLIKDDAICEFAATHLQQTEAFRIHFSGSLVTEHLIGAHPLMCFNEMLYTLTHYQSIPFVIDDDAPPFYLLLPGLTNQHVRLHPSQKQKYHALCVMSGNFSCMLWQKFFMSLEQEFNMPASIGFPYLAQQTQNLLNEYETALTGPLVRQDQKTIQNHLIALDHDPFQSVYQSFISCFQQWKRRVK